MQKRVAIQSMVAAVLVAGCHTMRPVPAADLRASRLPERVWVTRADHSIVVVNDPQLSGDTLRGYVFGEYQQIPVSQAVAIREQHRAPARTAALVVSATAVTLAGIVLMGNSKDVGGNAQTCTTGLPDDNPVACCRVQPNTPCG